MKNKQILTSEKDFIEDLIKKTVHDSMTHALEFMRSPKNEMDTLMVSNRKKSRLAMVI